MISLPNGRYRKPLAKVFPKGLTVIVGLVEICVRRKVAEPVTARRRSFLFCFVHVHFRGSVVRLSHSSAPFFRHPSKLWARVAPSFGLRPNAVTAAGRGVSLGGSRATAAADTASLSFAAGFNAALAEPSRAHKLPLGDLVDRHAIGFAVEGAGMATALIDLLDPAGIRPGGRMRRSVNLLDAYGDSHPYTLHCGFGWAFERLGRQPRHLAWCDPLMRWLVFDGIGFARMFRQGAGALTGPRGLAGRVSGDAARHVDQGIGRSLPFLVPAEAIPRLIATAPHTRHPDLWGGVGLAATYAAGPDQHQLRLLQTASGEHRRELAVGSIAAAQARTAGAADNADTEAAVAVLTGLSIQDALTIHDDCLVGLEPLSAGSAYQQWRDRVAARAAELRTQDTKEGTPA
ncbi:DUF1702 family protein [Actinomycetota bacterium]